MEDTVNYYVHEAKLAQTFKFWKVPTEVEMK